MIKMASNLLDYKIYLYYLIIVKPTIQTIWLIYKILINLITKRKIPLNSFMIFKKNAKIF